MFLKIFMPTVVVKREDIGFLQLDFRNRRGLVGPDGSEILLKDSAGQGLRRMRLAGPCEDLRQQNNHFRTAGGLIPHIPRHDAFVACECTYYTVYIFLQPWVLRRILKR